MSNVPRPAENRVIEISKPRRAKVKLPPSNTTRWVPRRKAEVVAAVDMGVISAEEACERYRLTMEELLSWKELVRKHGLKGLRVTQLQRYQRRSMRRVY